MKVIALASQKGGVGKTTLSGHLAVEAERQGAGPVALVDTDPQHSLTDWWQARKAETPLFAKVDLDNLTQGLADLRKQGIALVIIDTPPAIIASISAVVAASDIVIIPTRPSPHDLRAVGATVDLVRALDKPMIFVVNGAANRARITGDAAVELSQHGTVAPVTVYQRTDFASSMIDGHTAQEVDPDSRSAAEITALWTYVSKRMSKEGSK